MPSSSPSAIAPKPVLLFAVHAFLLALLVGYWPSARAVYPALFRAEAELVFGSSEAPALTLREATGTSLEEKDTFVEAFEQRGAAEPIWRLVISAVRLGYWPSAVLVALLLATPLAARRRGIAILVGLVWLHAFALGRLGVDILRADAELHQAGAAATDSALFAYRTLSQVLNSNIVVIAAVFLGWVVVSQPRQTLEMGSLARLLGSPQRRVP